MATQSIYKGKLFEVFEWEENGVCQVTNFLSELDEENNSDSKRLVYLIKRTADAGIIKNKKQSRVLRNGIYEFKAPNTARILYFFDKNRIIICTNAFGGKSGAGKTPKSEIERAESIRERYLKGKRDVKN